MSVGKDVSFGPRLKWFRQAIGEPWVYAAHDGRSGRAFYIAIGLAHPAKGFTRETGSFKPDTAELIAMAKTMGYPEDQAQEVGVWLHNGFGDPPPAPPGITAKAIPFPKEASPAGSARNPHKAPPKKPVQLEAAISTPIPEPTELAHAKEIASDLVLEAAERGEKLPAKVLELVRAVRSLGASMKKPLAAFLATLGLVLGEAGVEPAWGCQTPGDFKSGESDENLDTDEVAHVGSKRLRKSKPTLRTFGLPHLAHQS